MTEDEALEELKTFLENYKPPSRAEQIKYALTHGPEDDAKCYRCGKSICDCWRDK